MAHSPPSEQPVMDERTHPTETVTLFAPPHGALAAEQRRVEQLAARLGLGRTQLSAFHAVMSWATLLRPSTDARDREALRDYLDVMGYLPGDRKIVASAERSRAAVDAAVPALLEGLARGGPDPEAFLAAAAERSVAGLTRSQIELLRSILRHQRALDETDLRDLVAQFPFPVTRLNF